MGFGVVAEQSTGYPGYNSIMTRDKATIGRILKDNGYWTSWFGKDHNTPEFQASQAGPFDQWPTGMGFDYFYGFVGGDAKQWAPNLFRIDRGDASQILNRIVGFCRDEVPARVVVIRVDRRGCMSLIFLIHSGVGSHLVPP
jgi:hypothetical protein